MRDDGGIDVPDLIGARRTEADLRLRWMDTEARPPPPKPSHQAVPGRRSGPDPVQPLCEHGKRTRRNVSVVRRGHHFLNTLDFGWRQSMWRCTRTG